MSSEVSRDAGRAEHPQLHDRSPQALLREGQLGAAWRCPQGGIAQEFEAPETVGDPSPSSAAAVTHAGRWHGGKAGGPMAHTCSRGICQTMRTRPAPPAAVAWPSCSRVGGPGPRRPAARSWPWASGPRRPRLGTCRAGAGGPGRGSPLAGAPGSRALGRVGGPGRRRRRCPGWPGPGGSAQPGPASEARPAHAEPWPLARSIPLLIVLGVSAGWRAVPGGPVLVGLEGGCSHDQERQARGARGGRPGPVLQGHRVKLGPPGRTHSPATHHSGCPRTQRLRRKTVPRPQSPALPATLRSAFRTTAEKYSHGFCQRYLSRVRA